MPVLPQITRRTGVRAVVRESTPHRLSAEVWEAAGAPSTGCHSHPHQELKLEVLEGLLAIEVGGVEQVYGPGDRVTVRPGVRHAVRNPIGEDLHYRAHFSPGLRTEQFVNDVSRKPGPLRSLALLWRYRHEVRPAFST